MINDDLRNILETGMKEGKMPSHEISKYDSFIADSRRVIEKAFDLKKIGIPEAVKANILMRLYREALDIVLVLKRIEKAEEDEVKDVLNQMLINEWQMNRVKEEDGGGRLEESPLKAYLNFRSYFVDLSEREYGRMAGDIRTGLTNREKGPMLAKRLRRLLLDEAISEPVKKFIRKELLDVNFDKIGAERHKHS